MTRVLSLRARCPRTPVAATDAARCRTSHREFSTENLPSRLAHEAGHPLRPAGGTGPFLTIFGFFLRPRAAARALEGRRWPRLPRIRENPPSSPHQNAGPAADDGAREPTKRAGGLSAGEPLSRATGMPRGKRRRGFVPSLPAGSSIQRLPGLHESAPVPPATFQLMPANR